VDQETAPLGYGIFTDQPGNTSWLMLAKDFQSMSHKNMELGFVNEFLIKYCSQHNLVLVILCGLTWMFALKQMLLGSSAER